MRNRPPPIRFDNLVRFPGIRRGGGEGGPGDVVCYLDKFSLKERIVQRAWDLGPYDFRGSEVHILPELSSATLRRRGMLRSILSHIKQHGYTYKWGLPFHLVVRRDMNLFFLRCPADLPDLFTFLEIPPVDVMDWLEPWPALSVGVYALGKPEIRIKNWMRTPKDWEGWDLPPRRWTNFMLSVLFL